MMSPEFSKYISIWEDKVRNAGHGAYIEGVKYFVCHDDFRKLAVDTIEARGGQSLPELTHLPFPRTGIVCKENGMVVVLTVWLHEGGLNVHGALCDNDGASELPHALLDGKKKTIYVDPSMGEQAVNLMWALTYSAVTFLLQVNELGGTAFVSSPHESNPRRKAKGKRPLFTWTTVNLDAPRYISEPKGGTHASPRLHDRRGHWVTSKLGKRFWRKDAKVGSAKNGIAFQTYQKGIESDE